MMNKLTKYFIAVCCCVVIVVMFIWGQSIVTFENSVNESQFLLKFVRPIYEAVFGVGTLDGYTWRKLAHVIEFFVLGVFASLLALILVKLLWKKQFGVITVFMAILSSEILCVTVAIIDELIQTTNNRHPQVSDVILDSIGALVAIILTTAIFLLIWKVIKWRKQKKHT